MLHLYLVNQSIPSAMTRSFFDANSSQNIDNSILGAINMLKEVKIFAAVVPDKEQPESVKLSCFFTGTA